MKAEESNSRVLICAARWSAQGGDWQHRRVVECSPSWEKSYYIKEG